MRPSLRASSRRGFRRTVWGAILAALVAIAGVESATHGHVPAIAGWHDAAPHGIASHDDGLKPCSICRLAHERSVAAAMPLIFVRPVAHVDRPAPKRDALSLATVARERSPRAPPASPAC